MSCSVAGEEEDEEVDLIFEELKCSIGVRFHKYHCFLLASLPRNPSG